MRLHQSWTGVTKHFQQDEGEVPSHDMTIIQSVSYRDRSLSRGRTHMDLETPVGGCSEFRVIGVV
jgi:hypothetical protein